MVGYYRAAGGFLMSHSNTMAPFFAEEKKKKKKKALKKESLKKYKPIIKDKDEHYDNIKLFKFPIKIKM